MVVEENFTVPPVHPQFHLNKLHYDDLDLKDEAGRLIKEGEAHEAAVGNFLLEWLNPAPFVEVKTSGSTGTPKTIKVKKKHMVNSAMATSDFFNLGPGTKALLCLPASYIAGKMMLVRALVLGWELDLVPPKANPLDNLFRIYDFCAMTPFQLDNSIGRLHLIKKLIVGGGAVSENLKKLVQDKETKVFETYGMTETVTHIAAKKINQRKEAGGILPFKLLPNISISTDERSCLVINAPLLTDETIITNDVVEILTYKKFLWKGRYDNVINTGGIKIHPEEVELKLNPIILHRFFVSSLPDDALGNKLVLFVEADFSEEKLMALEQKISELQTLSKYEKPKKIYFVEKFEETHTGKINRLNTVRGKV